MTNFSTIFVLRFFSFGFQVQVHNLTILPSLAKNLLYFICFNVKYAFHKPQEGRQKQKTKNVCNTFRIFRNHIRLDSQRIIQNIHLQVIIF